MRRLRRAWRALRGIDTEMDDGAYVMFVQHGVRMILRAETLDVSMDNRIGDGMTGVITGIIRREAL